MATMSVRLDDDMKLELDRYAARLGVNASDLLRDQLARILGRPADDRDGPGSPQRLSIVDRKMLMNQHQILAHLESDDREKQHHEKAMEVLREGYTLEYQTVFGGFDSELSISDCRLARDILDMFRVVKHSVAQLTEAERASLGSAADYLKYRGLDGNESDESKIAWYINYLLEDGRWQESREDSKRADDGNSHAPMLPTYRSMVQRYRDVMTDGRGAYGRPRFELTVDELLEIAPEWVRPS